MYISISNTIDKFERKWALTSGSGFQLKHILYFCFLSVFKVSSVFVS